MTELANSYEHTYGNTPEKKTANVYLQNLSLMIPERKVVVFNPRSPNGMDKSHASTRLVNNLLWEACCMLGPAL